MRGRTWHARLTVTVEGESVHKWFDLSTDNKAVARRKLARLAKEHAETSGPPEQLAVSAARHETVLEAADRIFKERESEVRDIVNDPIRFNSHVASHIGKMIVTSVHQRSVVEEQLHRLLLFRTKPPLRLRKDALDARHLSGAALTR